MALKANTEEKSSFVQDFKTAWQRNPFPKVSMLEVQFSSNRGLVQIFMEWGGGGGGGEGVQRNGLQEKRFRKDPLLGLKKASGLPPLISYSILNPTPPPPPPHHNF